MARKRGHTKEYVEAMKDAEPTKYAPDRPGSDRKTVTDEWYAWHKRKLVWEEEKYGQHVSWGRISDDQDDWKFA